MLADDVCLEGITVLVQLIANNALDDQSRMLLTSSLLFGLPKPNGDIRPIAVGELFVKLAARYCFDLSAPHFPGHFEPVQLAVGSPNGCERAMQIIQARIESDPTGLIAIHIDFANAYNAVDRAAMLESVFSDPNMRHLWRAYSFIYGASSTLVIRDRGAIVDTISSEQGGKQGCVLAGLGFAHVFQPVYAAALAAFPSITARAIVDDFSMVGPAADVFKAYDLILTAADRLNVTVNTTTTVVQQAAGAPSSLTTQEASARHLNVVCGNVGYLGGYVGVDDEAASEWLEKELLSLSPISRAINDPKLPIATAIQLTKVCELAKPIFLARSLPFRVTQLPLTELDDKVMSAVMERRLALPTPLPTTAHQSVSQPVDQGGFGFRSFRVIGAAAKWASAASVAHDLEDLASASLHDLPFVVDREAAYNVMITAGVPTTDAMTAAAVQVPSSDADDKRRFVNDRFKVLPRRADMVGTFYGGEPSLPLLQRMLSRQLERASLLAFENSADFTQEDRIRFEACKAASSSRFLFPNTALKPMSDFELKVAVRLRAGLPPPGVWPDLCPLCHRDTSADPWHPFACEAIRRLSVTRRHDAAAHHFMAFARSNGCLANIVAKDPNGLIPDGELFLASDSIFFDVSGVHTLAPSHLSPSSTARTAVEEREAFKISKYSAYAEERHGKIVPIVLDCFGMLGDHAVSLIDVIIDEGGSPLLGSALPARMSKQLFIDTLSQIWQIGNAKIIREWQTLARKAIDIRAR